MLKKIQRFVKREFELNQRQANIFLLLSIIFILLLSWSFYQPRLEEDDIDYTLEYILEDSTATAKAEAFLAKVEVPQKVKKRIYKKRKETNINLGDLNTVVAEDLQKIRGIGKVLSTRIIKFRDLLGGFYSLDQLYEVYGLDSNLVQIVQSQTLLDSSFTKLDINLSNYNDLKSHPYLSWKQAALISKLRKQKIFLNENDLEEVLDSVTFIKVQPYLLY